METCPEEEVMKQENFPHSRKPSHRGSVGSFGLSEGHITGRKNNNNNKKPKKPSFSTSEAMCILVEFFF